MQLLPILTLISLYYYGMDTQFPGPVENPFTGSNSMSPQWNDLSQELYGSVHELVLSGSDVYAGGNFQDADGDPDADYLARWDGCRWHAVGPGLNGTVRAIAIHGSDIYVGGEFSQPFPNIARWDGNQWYPLGAGPLEVVNSLVIDSSEIIVGCGNWNSGFVSMWNGTAWQMLGPVLNGMVNVVKKKGADLYAAGNFTNVDGNPDADGIVKWNGSTWLSLGTGVPVTSTFVGIREILFHEDDLYIGGVFINAGGNPHADCIAIWNGSSWNNLGVLPYPYGLFPMTMFDGYLYTASGIGWNPGVDGLYRWNFSTEAWEVFELTETGPDDPLLVLESDNDNLYVGGYNMIIDGISYGGLVRWGAPFQSEITISGIPDVLCETEMPISLPTNQGGYAGNWTGIGVMNNVFDPSGLMESITLTFVPDNNFCPVDFIITVYDCSTPPQIDWKWAKAISGDNAREGIGIPYVYGIATDTSDAAYTTGYFAHEVDFDPGPNEYLMTAYGVVDGFVCKLNSDGDFVWARQIGGAGSGVIAYAIDSDREGNVFITGGFSSFVDFDPGPQTHTLYAFGESDIFILKLNQNGEFQWVKNIGGVLGGCWGSHISIEENTSNIYTTGTTSGQIDFDPGTGVFLMGNGDPKYNIFISKLDSLGNFIWAKEIRGPTEWSFTSGTSIAIDQTNGNIYTAGHFYGTCDFDTGPGIDSMTSNGEADVFLLKLDSHGDYQWALQMGGVSNDYCPAVALGSSGNDNLYVSGGYNGTVDFDPGPGVFNLTSADELFICKLDSAGHFIWGKSFGGSGGLTGYTGAYLHVDTFENETLVATGGFAGTADFDPGPENYELTTTGELDLFVTKMDSSGNFIWVETAGGITNDYGISLVLSDDHKILTTGNYESPTLSFDGTTLTNTTYPNVFVAKLGGCTTIVTNTHDSGSGSLRDIVQCAQSGDLITFDLPAMSLINLTTGEIIVGKNLTLLGPGITDLTISGYNNSRIFYLPSNQDFQVEGLSLKNSNALSNGGSILIRGNLTLREVLLENNFQNGIAKALTLSSPGHLTIEGMVDIQY